MSLENNNSVLEENIPSVSAEEPVAPVEETAAEVTPAAESAVQETPVPEVTEAAPAEPKAPVVTPKKKAPKKPHIAVRIPLQLLSLVLCVALLVGVIAAVLVADLRRVTTKDGIKQIIVSLLDRPTVVRPIVGAAGIRLSSTTDQASSATQDALIDLVMQNLVMEDGTPIDISREEIEAFVEESTVKDFLADKVAGHAADFITGEITTEITTEEIQQLVEENKELIEEHFDVEVNEEFTQVVTTIVEEQDIDTVVREEVLGTVGNMTIGGGGNFAPDGPNSDGSGSSGDSGTPNQPGASQGMTINELVAMLQEISSDEVMYTAVGICAGIALLLLLCNFYSIPGGLGWISAPVILAGLILSAPVYFILGSPETLVMLLEGQAVIADVITGVLATIAPVHYTVLGIGAGTAVLSIITRIIRAVIRKKKYA